MVALRREAWRDEAIVSFSTRLGMLCHVIERHVDAEGLAYRAARTEESIARKACAKARGIGQSA